MCKCLHMCYIILILSCPEINLKRRSFSMIQKCILDMLCRGIFIRIFLKKYSGLVKTVNKTRRNIFKQMEMKIYSFIFNLLHK